MADQQAIERSERTDEDAGTIEANDADGPDERDELEQLGSGAQQFIEGMGLYYERLGIPRIGGRILGLLMLVERPLTLDDMARTLKVSRASVSTNARTSVAVGMVEHVSLPGDRRDYYVFSPNAWTRRIEIAFPLLDLLRRLAEQGLATIGPENTAGREHLQMAIEFCDFYQKEIEESVVRWKARVAERGAREVASGRRSND